MEEALEISSQNNIHCHLIAPAKVKTLVLRKILAELGVTVDSIDDLAPPGESLPSELIQRLRRADFVCGVLPSDDSRAANVVFELGAAMGLGRPIFLIADSQKQVPNTLRAFPYLDASLEDIEAMRFHIGAFLKNMDSTTKAALEPRETITGLKHKHFDRLNALLQGAAVPQLSENALVELASEAFRTMGIEVSVEERLGDRSRPDIVAWPEDSSFDLGSPILVEIKKNERAADQHHAIEQVARYLEAASVRTGVLLIPGIGSEISVSAAPTGYIFTLSFEAFLALTEKGNLIRALVEARNRFFHGS